MLHIASQLPQPTKAVLFDMDGVLADSESFYVRRRQAYLATQGIQQEFGPDFVGIANDLIWQKIIPDNPARREELQAGYEAYSEIHPADYAKIGNPEALLVMRRLHEAGVKCAIASSSFDYMVASLVDALGLAPYLDLTITGWEVGAFKPDPTIYLEAMRRLGVAPEHALIVEDSATGIEAGVASGATVAALKQYAPDSDQSAAQLHIAKLSDLLVLLGIEAELMAGGNLVE